MPVVKIHTALPQEEYEKFKLKMQQLKMKEYSLAQEYILVCLNETSKYEVRKALYKLYKFLENDLKELGENVARF